MSDAKEVRCIYCKEVRQATREHVLQASLGGTLTISFVCGICNTGFSKIDQSLAENSLVALTRVGVTEKGAMPVNLGGDKFWRDRDGYWNDLRVKNGLQAVLMPQLHLTPHTERLQIGLAGGEHAAIERFLLLVDDIVAQERLLSVHVRVGPTDKCATARLVGYRDDAVYLRASSEEAGRDILRMLNEKWLGFRALQKASPPQPLQREEKPAVHIAMSICFDDNYRAIAKIAFNLLAAKMGAAFVLRDEFDPIRNYIRGIGLVHRAPLSDEEVAVDTRFVHAVPGDEKALIPTSTHAVLITYIPPDLVGIVTLYKKTSFIVRLAVIHLEEQLLEAHEFSIDRTSNKMLEISELARRLLGYEPADPTPATRSSPLASDRPYHPTRRPRDHEEP